MNEPKYTSLWKYISLILFSKGHSVCSKFEIDGETYIQRGDFLYHIFFLEPGGANACTPLQAVSSETS